MKKIILAGVAISSMLGIIVWQNTTETPAATEVATVTNAVPDKAELAEVVQESPAVSTTTTAVTNSPITEPQGEETPEPAPTPVATIPEFTSETLAQYDGTNPELPIYIAFSGDVYDVTPGRKFYEPGGMYHFLAGSDGTTLLKTFGGDLIKQKYKVIGVYLE